MIGKIINYGTDALLPEKYKYIGDYSCAIVDAATGDYASAAVLTAEGISENLKQTGNENAALAADVTGAAVSVAAGDINKAIQEGKTDSLKNAGLKMGAVGASAGVGKAVDDNQGVRIATSVATGSIGKDLHETAIKSGLSAAGISAGYKLKGKDGIVGGAALGSNTGNLAINSDNIIKNDKLGFEEAKQVKQNTTAVAKNAKELSEQEPKNKKQLREKIKEDQTFELLDKSTDATITSAQIATEKSSENTNNLDKIIELSGEVGHSANAACRIRETKIEIEDKTYKITDTLCYTADNYQNLKKEFEKKKGGSD